VIFDIHKAYLDAGADMIETDTFNGTSISQADYGLEPIVSIRPDTTHPPRRCTSSTRPQRSSRRRPAPPSWRRTPPARALSRALLARRTGPRRSLPLWRTLRTATFVRAEGGGCTIDSPAFVELVEAYTEQTRGLIDGGSDILFVETIFDTLNAKVPPPPPSMPTPPSPSRRQLSSPSTSTLSPPARAKSLSSYATMLHAIHPPPPPAQVSGTIVDLSGRTLSGQTVEGFLTSIAHSKPIWFTNSKKTD
jgi:5-methyltetrahydrofolate--homocysteine methyltransferase